MNYSHIKALLIDIDDTITRLNTRPNARLDEGESDWATAGLFNVFHSAGVKLGGLTPQEAARRINKIRTEIKWWHPSDFIVALELNPKKFWRYAHEEERRYLEPTGTEIRGALKKLHHAGILLYIASNNPSSGILHKLQVAGLATMNGTTIFSQLLGATELQAMKWEPMYWKKALAHTALDGDEVAIVGDNPHDDFEIPHSVGINHTFLINRGVDRSSESNSSVTYVMDFSMIAKCILEPPPVKKKIEYLSPRAHIIEANGSLMPNVKA